MPTALITGATSGIGLELAKIHASNHGNLVLTARNIRKLEEIKLELESKYSVSVFIIQKDLAHPTAPNEIYHETKNAGIKIDYLINNAGFGDFGHFSESDWSKQENMINLNITSLVHLTKLYLNDMIENKSGKIMNVASTAAFQPGPYMSVYYASKAFVLHFSEAINYELRKKEVTVTAFCPGPTLSGFQSAANMNESNLLKRGVMATSMEAAEYGYKAMMKGRTVAVHGFKNNLMTKAISLVPRNLVVKAVSFVQGNEKL
jgi:uncharacterized protein